mgnify:CR=1 FL=1
MARAIRSVRHRARREAGELAHRLQLLGEIAALILAARRPV